MIYTVTFNPALDYVMNVKNFKIGSTNRSFAEEIHFGGKGINVSVVLAELEIDNTALGFVAGFTGCELEARLHKKGINCDFVKTQNGFTRINVKLKGECETEINANGPQITQAELGLLLGKLEKIGAGDTLVLAGSIPSCLPDDIYEKILDMHSNKGVNFVVDATDKLLLNCLKYKPFLIKPNLYELSQLVGRTLENEEQIIASARELKEMGAVNVLVSLGADGAILVDEYNTVHKAPPHRITAINTVGAGDSVVAGFLAGCKRSYDFALRLGNAAGAATAGKPGLATACDIKKLLNQTSL
ncbi:MAG: 1-phosphofructokinase [Clostridia bacterium]|nr:1-phosphofructokinase [Clostridia bacterium]